MGPWIENTEGAKLWMKVFNDLKTRRGNDILIAVTDGRKGMPEALGAVFLATTLQTCTVHLIRSSLDYASWKERKALAAAIEPIYTAASAEAAQAAVDAFEQGPWGAQVHHRRGRLAQGLGQSDPVLRFRAGGASPDLHNQRAGDRECAAAQDHQDARALPQQLSGHQADMAGAAQHHGRLEPCRAHLEGGDEPVRDPV